MYPPGPETWIEAFAPEGRSTTETASDPATTANGIDPDCPPPGDGFTTVMASVPLTLSALADICAVSEVDETYVVDSATPFALTAEDGVKPVPARVINVPPLLMEAEDGDTSETVGTG